MDWSVVGPRDEGRRARVLAILEEGRATTAVDFYHAAMVYQHGTQPSDHLCAHELALRSAEMGYDDARWLAAAAQDRYLMGQSRPQRYGTQFRTKNGRWELYEVDPNITDTERARWNVPPLSEARAKVVKMNEASAAGD
jgi:hypothetical protein